MTEVRQKKIAIIGSAEPRYDSREVRVACFPWNKLKRLTNLADYDIVIFDLLSLEDPSKLDGNALRKILDLRTAQEVLRKRNGAFYVLGDPRFSIKWRSAEGEEWALFLYWTGVRFDWDGRAGDTVEREWRASRGSFKPFADALSSWNYSLAAARPEVEEFSKVWNVEYMQRARATQPAVLIDTICTNSYGHNLVFSVHHASEEMVVQNGVRVSGDKEPLSGPVYFLPESEFSEEKVLEFVLRDLCDVDVSAPEPEWVAEYVVPGQEQLDREIDEIEAHIKGLLKDHARKVEERKAVRKPLKLLYETGPPLEEATRSVLESLGAEVERPADDRKNKEDGWVTVRVGVDTFEGVLEVKGVKSEQFDTYGLRQLTTWIHRGISSRRKRYTGIFVGNSAREDPPRRRIWPFSKDWLEEADLLGYVAILTADLYALYLLDRTDRLDRDTFWRDLFSTKGPFDMRPYLEKLHNEEKDPLGRLSAAIIVRVASTIARPTSRLRSDFLLRA
jgi:hypothetical protein